jgi:prepilin-type N-terminal cleavage/methylation domain-containing protein
MNKLSRRDKSNSGFSLVELLITTVILGIFSGIAINITLGEIDRSKINSAQVSLAGWLQVIQRGSLLQKSSINTQGGCTVTFATSFSSQGNGSEIARVEPSTCAPNPILELDVLSLGGSTISASFTSQAITFTPRGTILTSAENPVTEIKLLINRSSLLRCVRLTGISGVIEIGSNSAGSSLSSQCSDYTKV